MTMEKTIQNLKKMKTDAVYGKKKHFNAADRKQVNYNIINFVIFNF
jgi:hypothetical protein